MSTLSYAARVAALTLLFMVTFVSIGPAQDPADELMKAAMKAHQAGCKCLDAARKPGANQFLENEKAIGHLEQAQRLLEKFLEMRPEEPNAEALMQDVLSLLFWCHKMSPMVDPEEVEPEPAEPPTSTEAAPPTATDAGPAPPVEPAPPAAPPPSEEEARALLEQAREYQKANPADGMGALAKLFYVSETFPGTAAAAEAKAEAEKLQGELFAVAPVVPARVVLQPLTRQDKAAIDKALRDWLDNRRRLHCSSCKGVGHTECKTCDGSGEIAGRAGRRSTCTRCRRGKVACERRGCVEGIDARTLEKVVVDSRAPYYQEKLRALLGGHAQAVEKFTEALAAVLSESPRAPAEISRAATELGIAPVQLRDVIDTHGPSAHVAREFSNFSLGEIERKVRYTIRGDETYDETVSFEQQDGKWYLRRISAEE